jgi:hypothetical protein
VGEAVADISKLALLDVLLDGVERLLLGDLLGELARLSRRGTTAVQVAVRTNSHLHLRIGPSRDLHDHVEDSLLFIGIQRDVVEGRDGDAILLDEDAVLEGVGGTNPARSVLTTSFGGHCCGV